MIRWLRSARTLLSLALVAVFACVHARAQAAYPIAGVVVDLLSGDPVPDAVLRLESHDQNTLLATTRSAADGSFHLPPVAAGKYSLLAFRHGYQLSAYQQHDNYSSAIVTGSGLDAAHLIFPLPRISVVRGTVTDDAGQPVSGARVLLYRRSGVESATPTTRLTASVATLADGSYEFSEQTPGEYHIAVVAEPWYARHHTGAGIALSPELDVAYPVTYFDSTTDEAASTPLHLGPGVEVRANLALHAVPALHMALAGLQDANAAFDGSVQLRAHIFGQLLDTPTGSVTSAPTDGLELTGFAPGSYELAATQQGVRMSLTAAASGPIPLDQAKAASPIHGSLENLDGKPIDAPTQLTFTVAAAGPETVTDSGFAPIQFAPIQTVAQGGQFALETMPAGSWTVRLADSYGVPLVVDSIVYGQSESHGPRFTADGAAPRLRIRAHSGRVTLQGVARAGGKPMAGVMIVLLPADSAQTAQMARRDQSDSDGSFALLSVQPGRYTLLALADAWDLDWSHPGALARYLPGGQPVTVSAGQSGVVALSRPLAVQPR